MARVLIVTDRWFNTRGSRKSIEKFVGNGKVRPMAPTSHFPLNWSRFSWCFGCFRLRCAHCRGSNFQLLLREKINSGEIESEMCQNYFYFLVGYLAITRVVCDRLAWDFAWRELIV